MTRVDGWPHRKVYLRSCCLLAKFEFPSLLLLTAGLFEQHFQLSATIGIWLGRFAIIPCCELRNDQLTDN